METTGYADVKAQVAILIGQRQCDICVSDLLGLHHAIWADAIAEDNINTSYALDCESLRVRLALLATCCEYTMENKEQLWMALLSLVLNLVQLNHVLCRAGYIYLRRSQGILPGISTCSATDYEFLLWIPVQWHEQNFLLATYKHRNTSCVALGQAVSTLTSSAYTKWYILNPFVLCKVTLYICLCHFWTIKMYHSIKPN